MDESLTDEPKRMFVCFRKPVCALANIGVAG